MLFNWVQMNLIILQVKPPQTIRLKEYFNLNIGIFNAVKYVIVHPNDYDYDDEKGF